MAWIDLNLPLEDADYFVRVVPFRTGAVGGAVMENEDGTYSLYMNADLPYDKQIEGGWHEFEHIAYDDFHNGRPIEEIENRK